MTPATSPTPCSPPAGPSPPTLLPPRLRSPAPTCRPGCKPHPSFNPSGTWWRITVNPPNSHSWYASFTQQVPAEILAGLTDTLLTPAPADPPDPWDLFRTAGWSVTQSENGTGFEARSLDRRAVVEYSRPYDDEISSSFSWRIRTREYPADAAESAFDGRPVWSGWLDGHAPAQAIAGFVAALTSAEPLLRGWGRHNWHHDVQHERTSRTGTDVADAHQQRLRPCPTWSVDSCPGHGEWTVGMDRSGRTVGISEA
ncbi:DUF317 domain-containing protein, partial [Streptomyces sp. AK08-02]|uniref:DUF317 domain-containing protein n=1 Tax=Streptomyces sp. AK08-02 TaxID=3028654 RepID=UPI0029BACB1C